MTYKHNRTLSCREQFSTSIDKNMILNNVTIAIACRSLVSGYFDKRGGWRDEQHAKQKINGIGIILT